MDSAGSQIRWHKRIRWAQRETLLVLGAYVALAIIMTWPVARQFGTHVPGRDGDAWIHLWTYRWVRDTLLSGRDLYYTNLLFFPNGTSLYSHNIAWVNIAVWLPLQAIFGEGAAYSLLFLGILVFNGFAAYLLIRELTESPFAAFFGGLIVAFWPYNLSHHDHLNLILIGWVSLALLYLKRFFDGQKKRDLILAAIFIALIGITRWQLLVLAGFLIGLYLLYRIIRDRLYQKPGIIGWLVAGVALAGLIMLPLMLPVITATLSGEVPSELILEETPYSTDLIAYLVPSKYHPLWGDAVSEFYSRFPVRSTVPFIGYTVLILAIIGVAAKWPQTRFWLLVAIIYIVLAMGPRLNLNGQIHGPPMPYSWIDDIFFIRFVRRPNRYNVILSLPVAILAAYGILYLQQRLRLRKLLAAVLTMALVFLVLVEYVVNYRTFSLEIPAWYSELTQQSETFGVLGIPMEPGMRPYKTYMHYQSAHEKPLVQGHISRVPPQATSFISDNLLLRKVRYEQMQVLAGEIVSVTGQLQPLADANIRYLILHKEFLSGEELAAWQSWLGYEPYHEDLELAVYRPDPELGRDFELVEVMTTGPDSEVEIGLIGATLDPTATFQGETESVQVGLNWFAGRDVVKDYNICLGIRSEADQQIDLPCEALAVQMPTSQWRDGELYFTEHTIDIDPYLDGGEQTVVLALLENGSTERPDDFVPAGTFSHNAVSRSFAAADPDLIANVAWGEYIFLPGFDLPVIEADTLTITAYWRALNRMDRSYTNFFHLIDPETGEVVAQADVIPRGWSYPTSWWDQGELVEDTVQLSLERVPPGQYRLHAGWYDLESGERLPAFSEAGERLADDSAPLITIER
jgi:hypothetical protein